ncbi:diguanylate cyclase (GGDEF)-like protein/PAS domain S-box-containing protein [Inhella inkyongensis]|uniref:Diguanylate cyclase (GGDEF)-like protein/PAS domain S-box-containing protein n=1 Tax=Inhella inkyongensis TaxID=392593 RepID=A0A840S2F7_9BURK|nr:diguanylate cyclase [Inhella inkyongensis]MBB5202871.1 diguanylate cyclase (GGDEF)-like protein/PAS domain S-box-containing protein [Inhella inkyongensis]
MSPPSQGLTQPLAERLATAWGLGLALGLGALAGALGGWIWGLAVLAGSATLALALLILHERHLRWRMAAGTEAMTALGVPLLILDQDDRLRWCSAAFVRLYPALAGKVARGVSYAEICRLVLESDVIDLEGHPPRDWLKQRLQRHQGQGDRWIQRMRDGRVLQVIENRTLSGGWASVRFDIGDQVALQDALRAARDEARAANELLEEALQAMPAGFEIWDAQDRLLRCNDRVREQYPTAAHLLQPGVRFEDVVRASLAAGAIPSAKGREAQWLGDRLAQRARLGRPFLMDYQGQWIQVDERRMPSGRVVTVRQDVTELVAARNALTQARQVAEQRTQLLERAVDALPVALYVWDPDGRLMLVNRLYRDWHPEIDYDALIGTDFEHTLRVSQAHGLLPQDAKGREEEWIAERVRLHGQRPELLQQLPDGRQILTHEQRTPEGFIVTVRQDVTALLSKERALASSKAQVEAIIRTAGAAIVTMDTEGRILYANLAAEQLWGYAGAELVGRSVVSLLHPDARAELVGLFEQHLRQPELDLIGPRREVQAQHRDGQVLTLLVAISEVRTADDHFFVGVINDISAAKRLEVELREANQRLEQLSRTDSLTGLANRRRLMEGLQELWQRGLRSRTPLGLLMVDVDHFKAYNDHHGHQAGDAALQALARVLQGAARRSTDVVARYGGEEFALLLDDCDGVAALERAEQIRSALAALQLPHGACPLGRLSVSIGATHLMPEPQLRPEEGLARADKALYQAKTQGRDRAVLLAD